MVVSTWNIVYCKTDLYRQLEAYNINSLLLGEIRHILLEPGGCPLIAE